LGLSERKFARNLGVSQSMIAKLENVKINPTYNLSTESSGTSTPPTDSSFHDNKGGENKGNSNQR